MPNLVEMIGQRDIEIARLNEEYSNLNAEYNKLWAVLNNVKNGTIAIDRVQLSVSDNGAHTWKVEPAVAAAEVKTDVYVEADASKPPDE